MTNRERPIILSGEMVKAILAGRKTQTRRVMKPQPPDCATEVFAWFAPHIATNKAEEGCYYRHPGGLVFHRKSPYGQPGDRLWVRETWTIHQNDKGADCLLYKADVPNPESYGPWQPSIFMPRHASRLALEVKEIRAERLRGISEEDARAEGMTPNWCGPDLSGWNPEEHGYLPIDYEGRYLPDDIVYCTAKEAFALSWDVINAKRGYTWASNPWVWVVSFEAVSG